MEQFLEVPCQGFPTGGIERLERLVHRAVVGAEDFDEVLRRQIPKDVAVPRRV